MRQLIIIGSGSAGYTAAVYAPHGVAVGAAFLSEITGGIAGRTAVEAHAFSRLPTSEMCDPS
ncbi:hypothetical protein ABZ793_33335 [Micromonospora sp. NPDC047465]|uniref:hypothetical protein n=1 Tax=Micromonospora sp. NPDC047465 TaxID=3154813 RepID=UPI00340D386A